MYGNKNKRRKKKSEQYRYKVKKYGHGIIEKFFSKLQKINKKRIAKKN